MTLKDIQGNNKLKIVDSGGTLDKEFVLDYVFEDVCIDY